MTGASVRRLLSRSCFGAAAIAFAAAVVPPGAGAQSVGSHPQIFAAGGDAIGVENFPDQNGGITPIQDTFRMSFVSGASTMSSSNGPTARAAVADPGNGLTKGPATGCAQAGPPLADAFPQFAPILEACNNATWPFVADADGFNTDPSTAGALSFGSPTGQLNGEGGGAHAHIGDDGSSSTDSTMSSLRIAPLPGGDSTGLPLPPGLLPGGGSTVPVDTSLFTVGSIQSTTKNFFDGATVVSHSESILNGVRFLGGLVTIDSITSIAEARYTGGADPAGASSTTVQGVNVLGQPATIDDQGLHGAGGAADALQSAGLSVRLVGATQGIDANGFMAAQSGGVVLDFTHAIDTGGTGSGTYFVRTNLASVDSKALARSITPPSKTSGSIGSPTLPTLPVGGTKPSGFTGGAVVAPAPPATTAGDTADTSLNDQTNFIGLDPGKIKLLYLAFTLATLGVCLVPRLALPARLPGPMKA